MDIIADNRKPCPASWHELSPLVQEALRLGFVIKSRQKITATVQQSSTRRPLPAGYRFYWDCLREDEARVLEWLIRKHPDNCWFFTGTFKDYMHPDKADRILRSFLARLSQAHNSIAGAALLKSVHTTEWQQRDVIHYHLLIYGDRLGSLSRKRWEFRWRMVSGGCDSRNGQKRLDRGGFSANYDAELKAAPYLVKHQIKDRHDGNLHLGGAWRGITPPRSTNSLRCADLDKEQRRGDGLYSSSLANNVNCSAPNGSRGVGDSLSPGQHSHCLRE